MLTRLFPHLLARGVVAEPAKAFGARHGVVNAKLLEEAFVVLLALKQLGVHANQPRNYDSAVRVCVVLAVQRGLCHPKGEAPNRSTIEHLSILLARILRPPGHRVYFGQCHRTHPTRISY